MLIPDLKSGFRDPRLPIWLQSRTRLALGNPWAGGLVDGQARVEIGPRAGLPEMYWLLFCLRARLLKGCGVPVSIHTHDLCNLIHSPLKTEDSLLHFQYPLSTLRSKHLKRK